MISHAEEQRHTPVHLELLMGFTFTESDVLSACLDYLRLRGILAWRTPTLVVELADHLQTDGEATGAVSMKDSSE